MNRYTLKYTIVLLLLLSTNIAYADDWAIKTIAYESSNQPFKGQVAVASVIKTRMSKRHKTAKQIVLQPKQFSCWSNSRPTQHRELTKRELRIARKAWNLSKVWEYTNYAVKGLSNYWTKKARKSLNIGGHTFYQF